MKNKKDKSIKEKIKKKLNFKIKLKENENKKLDKEKDNLINHFIPSEEIQFRKLSLEEIIPSLKENEINIERITIQRNVEENNQTKNELHIYDINNSIKKSDYHRTSDYQSSSGNYDMNQTSAQIPLLNSSEQDIGLNQKDQNRTYEISREKELKDKKRRMW